MIKFEIAPLKNVPQNSVVDVPITIKNTFDTELTMSLSAGCGCTNVPPNVTIPAGDSITIDAKQRVKTGEHTKTVTAGFTHNGKYQTVTGYIKYITV